MVRVPATKETKSNSLADEAPTRVPDTERELADSKHTMGVDGGRTRAWHDTRKQMMVVDEKGISGNAAYELHQAQRPVRELEGYNDVELP